MRILQILFTLKSKFLTNQNPPSQLISLDICGIPRMTLFNFFPQSQTSGPKLKQNLGYLK